MNGLILQDSRTKEAVALSAVSSSLLNLGRPLNGYDGQLATPINPYSELPGWVSPLSDVTRLKRSVASSDAGWKDSSNRFDSERFPIQAPCDMRSTTHELGTPSKLLGRNPVQYLTS